MKKRLGAEPIGIDKGKGWSLPKRDLQVKAFGQGAHYTLPFVTKALNIPSHGLKGLIYHHSKKLEERFVRLDTLLLRKGTPFPKK